MLFFFATIALASASLSEDGEWVQRIEKDHLGRKITTFVDKKSGISLPSPTCALNGIPCAPPRWEPSWNLTQSTLVQPSAEKFFIPIHPWGLVSLDWSVARSVWFNGNASQSNCETVSTTGCRLLKELGLAHRCFVYHNLELALEWMESQRAAMYNESLAHYFLRYPNGTIYNEPSIDHGDIHFGDQYFWNFTQPEVHDFFIESIFASIADDAVDGTYTDDVNGIPLEHDSLPRRLGMSEAEVSRHQYATQQTSQDLIDFLIVSGKYNWQAFGGGDGVGVGFSKENCHAFMETWCRPMTQAYTMTLLMNNTPEAANQTVAAFLVGRPPHGYIGYGWESDDKDWNDLFYLQAGEPIELCQQKIPGVFSREWTNGIAEIDCNHFTANLPFPSLAH